MKITFKSYDDLKALLTDSKSVPTVAKWDKTIYLGKGFDVDFDAFLKVIAGKTFEIQDYDVMPVGGQVLMRIQTAVIGKDGGFNTNYPFDDFCFTMDFVDSVEDAPTVWFCRGCGMIVDPAVQKDPFNPKNTYADTGIENAVCPACFTKTFSEVKFS